MSVYLNQFRNQKKLYYEFRSNQKAFGTDESSFILQ